MSFLSKMRRKQKKQRILRKILIKKKRMMSLMNKRKILRTKMMKMVNRRNLRENIITIIIKATIKIKKKKRRKYFKSISLLEDGLFMLH